MLSRTAEYAAHGPRSLSPALHMLDPEQRLRIAKSSLKVGKMLGEMPLIDVVPASPMDSVSSGMTSCTHVLPASWPLQDGRKGARFKRREPPPAPVLRYRLPPSQPQPLHSGVEEAVHPTRRPRKAIPHSLDLPLPEPNPFSPWRNGHLRSVSRASRTLEKNELTPYSDTLRTPITPEYISPLTPLTPLSPITTPDLHEHRLRTLGQLARRSRAFRDTLIGELPPPSPGQPSRPLDSVKTYLDLYRISARINPRHSQLLPRGGRRRSYSMGALVEKLKQVDAVAEQPVRNSNSDS
ncbi:hypothetical protein BN946_scf184942.g8 [Trametes cinnabarina]|uniref:Uncharacterized protein n=1 Tax=Pycnoporus cinnabarinus TaxID=5643 RepID=A0A060SCU6_PYCCI|nr:hypothetical protein BN946_scf184942.g8 [Trametes cinnabarina]